MINNYCDIANPVTTHRYDTCETIRKADKEFCKYNALCEGYSAKNKCEASKTYTRIMQEEIEIACKVEAENLSNK